MDAFFVETITNKTYRLAMVDRLNIFNSLNPGRLANVLDCSNDNPSVEDREQIFFTLAPNINGLDCYHDLFNKNHTCRLNIWTLFIVNGTVFPLNREISILLYGKQHSITPTEEELASPIYLNTPNNFQLWKTGLMQRCFFCLLRPEYFNNPKICSLLDEFYRKIMRFKIEIESKNNEEDKIMECFRKILFSLGLKNSRDTSLIEEISNNTNILCRDFCKLINREELSLTQIFELWSGSSLVQVSNQYKLVLNPDITEVLNCMVPLLVIPKSLILLEPL